MVSSTLSSEHVERVITVSTRTLPIAIAALCLVSCDGGDGGSGGAASDRPGTIGGSVTGLRGDGLVLQNNGGDPLTIGANGPFTFATPVAPFAQYSVTVLTQPTATPAETCSVANGNGTVGRGTVTSVTVTCRAVTGKYLYTLYLGTDPRVSGFLIDPITGALTEIPGSPFPLKGDSGSLSDLYTSGKFLFMTGQFVEAYRWLTGHAIDSATGALTLIPGMPIRQPFGTGAPSFHPRGQALYFSSQGILHARSIDPTSGALTPAPGSPYGFGESYVPGAPVFNPAGTTAFVLFSGMVIRGGVSSFAVDATTGGLTFQGGTDQLLENVGPLVVHPGGKFAFMRGRGHLRVLGIENPASIVVVTDLFVSENQGDFTGVRPMIDETGQYVYFVSDERAAGQTSGRFLFGNRFDMASGALTPLAGSPYPTNSNSTPGFVMDPTRRFIIAHHVAFGVAVFEINASTGELTHASGSPFMPTVGTVPNQVVFDPSGNFAYMPDGPSFSVSLYSFDSTNGRFAFVGSYPLPGQPFRTVIAGLQ